MLQIKDHPTKATVYRAGDTWIRQYKSMHDLIHDAGKIDSSVASGTFERGCDWTWGGGHDDVPGTLRKIGNGLPLPDADYDRFEQAQRDFKRAAAKAMDTAKVSGKRRRVDKRMGGRIKMSRIFNDHPKPFVRKTRKATAPMLRVGFRSNGNGYVDAAGLAHTAALAAGLTRCLFRNGFSVELSSVVASSFGRKWDICATTVVPSGTKPSTPRILACSTPAIHRCLAATVREVDIGQKFGSADEIPEYYRTKYWDVFVNLDSTQGKVVQQLVDVLGRIKDKSLTNER